MSESRILLAPAVVWFLIVVPSGTATGLTPFLGIPIGSSTIPLGDIVFLAWALLVLSSALVTGERGNLRNPQTWALVLVGWAAAMAVVGISRGFGTTSVLRDLRGFLFYAAALPAALEIRSREYALRLTFHVFAAIVAYAAVICLLALLPDNAPVVKETIEYWYGNRRLHFHNTFMLPVGLAVAVALALYASGTVRFYAAMSCVPIVAALLLSQTRSAILTAMAGAIVVVAVGAIRRAPRLRLSEAGLLSLGLLLAPPVLIILISLRHSIAGRLAELLQNPTAIGTFVDRLATFLTAVNLWAEHPVTGWGLGKLVSIPWATVSYKPWLAALGSSGELPGVDNSVLTVGFKTGLVGTLLLAVVWGMILHRGLVVIRRADPHSPEFLTGVGLVAGLLGYLATAVTQNVLVFYQSIAVWMIVARCFSETAHHGRNAADIPLGGEPPG